MKKLFLVLTVVASCAESMAQKDISGKLDSMLTIYTNCNKFNGSVAKRMMAVLYGQPYSLLEAPLQLSAEKLQHYAGMFGADGHTFEVRLIDGHLFGMEEEHAKELLPVTGNRLRFMAHQDEEGVFDVTMDANGQAAELFTINPRGMRLTLKKIK